MTAAPPSIVGTRFARHYARSFVIMQLVSFWSKEMLRAQLRVRTRLVRIVAAAIRHYGDWKKLPNTGSDSWYALFPEGDIQRVEDGISAELAGDSDAPPVETTDTHVAA